MYLRTSPAPNPMGDCLSVPNHSLSFIVVISYLPPKRYSVNDKGRQKTITENKTRIHIIIFFFKIEDSWTKIVIFYSQRTNDTWQASFLLR